MFNYTFNKSEFEFYMSDGSTVQSYQIENGSVWTLEIFPKNQTRESFEKAEFIGHIVIFEKPKQIIPYCASSSFDYGINYPYEWNSNLKKEFYENLLCELEQVKLIKREEV